jgi:cytochrome P450
LNPYAGVALRELEADPYPFYARLRREDPVIHLPLIDQWLITRWEDCEVVGSDASRTGHRIRNSYDFFGFNIVSAEDDAHAWLRAGVDPPLRPRAVQSYIEQRARPVAIEHLERLRPLGRADATIEYLELVSVRVIGDVLGLGDVDDATLQDWFHALSAGFTNVARDPALTVRAERARTALDAHVRATIERLTAEPDDSGLSHMIHTGVDDGPPRTYDELIGTVRVIVLGGFQEPGHGAAASLLGVLLDEAQRDAVLTDPALLGAAVHEGLRWLAPFATVDRTARVDLEVAGVTIPAGAEIALSIASANRDERRYADGERFDLFRERQGHASFGYGAHFCSGHFIARRLEQIMLEELFARLPGLRLDPDRAPVVRGFKVRGVKHLPVVWDA